MSLIRSLLLLAGIVVATLPTAAWAQPYMESGRPAAVGGSGGGDFQQACEENEVLDGVNVSFGKDMNSVSAVCKRVENGLAVEDSKHHLGTYGQAGGSEGYASCGGGLVEGMYVETSKVNIVHHVELVCRMFAGGYKQGFVYQSTRLLRLSHGGEAARRDLVTCGPNSYAIGIYGGYGSLVDRLGIICGKERTAAPAKQTGKVYKQTGKPKSSKAPPAPVNNDDGAADTGGDNGGNDAGGGDGGAGSRTAAVATTIYDQPQGSDVAYLDPGDPVTIVQCGKVENWCQISKPRKGWVWGPDLD